MEQSTAQAIRIQTEHARAQKKFQDAIDQGRLSDDPTAPNFAGNYMYMCDDQDGKSLFKDRLTRSYID